MNIVSRALEIATEGHKGQHRWDKSPYINHPIAVADIAVGLNESLGLNLRDDILRAMSLTHDLAEDVLKYLNNETLIETKVFDGLFDDGAQHNRAMFRTGLYALNKHRHKSYLDFVLVAKAHSYARIVKTADLTHNLRALTKGSMKEKYELALYILNN